MPACKLCAAETAPFGEQIVLGRHRAAYRRCTACGYVFVEDPHWLDEAYASSAIAALDTGMAHRNLWLADTVAALLALRFRDVGRCLDFGGGSGLFVRLLRDRGYDFRWQDRHCPNLFARGFEAGDGERFDLITCFEVVEHLVDPLATFDALAARAPTLVFATELLPATGNRPGEWHYYAPQAGQHVGFFTRASLEGVARRLGRHFASDGRQLHVIATRRIDDRLLRLLARKRWARRLARRFDRRPPLTWSDAALLEQRLPTAQRPAP